MSFGTYFFREVSSRTGLSLVRLEGIFVDSEQNLTW